MKRFISAAAFAVAAMALPAQAASVSVTLDLSALEPVASVDYAACIVSVPEGANGIAVLGAAKASGCIKSYEVKDTGFGPYVACIDGICDGAATYWRMTVNGGYTLYGVQEFSASAGKVLGFSYTQWVTCLADQAAC